MRYTTAIFDLDGTITDSGQGIMNAIRYAVKKHALPEISDEVLRSFIGPPLKEQFRKVFGLSEEELWSQPTGNITVIKESLRTVFTTVCRRCSRG